MEEQTKEKLITEDLNNVVSNILFSYESRIQSMGSVLDTTHQILQGFQDALINPRKEREKVSAELRENLAKNESLRKKDFDNMMQGILLIQNEREKEVKNLLNLYLNEQREMAQVLRENLTRFKDSLSKGEIQRIKEFQEAIKEILSEQEKRREEATSRLREFQNEQRVLVSRLKVLLAKGRSLRIKDLKSMLKEFRAQHKERVAQQEKRKETVRQMLDAFKKKRVGVAENWKDWQQNKDRKGSDSSHEIRPIKNNPGGKNILPLTGLSRWVNIDAPKEGAEKFHNKNIGGKYGISK